MPVRVRTKMGAPYPISGYSPRRIASAYARIALRACSETKSRLQSVIADGTENNRAIAIPAGKLENQSAYGPDAAPSCFPDQGWEGLVTQGARKVTQLHPGFPVERGRVIEWLLRSRPSAVCGAGRSTPRRHSGSSCGARPRHAVRRRQALHVLLDPGQDEELPLPVRQRRPGVTSHAVRSCSRTSASCSSRLATMPLPIAMYSKSFVGEPKNLLPSGIGRCGETRMSEASRYSATLSLGSDPVNITAPVFSYAARAERISPWSKPVPIKTKRSRHGRGRLNRLMMACCSTPIPCHRLNDPAKPTSTSSCSTSSSLRPASLPRPGKK